MHLVETCRHHAWIGIRHYMCVCVCVQPLRDYICAGGYAARPGVNDRQLFVVSGYVLPIRVKCWMGAHHLRSLRNPSYQTETLPTCSSFIFLLLNFQINVWQ